MISRILAAFARGWHFYRRARRYAEYVDVLLTPYERRVTEWSMRAVVVLVLVGWLVIIQLTRGAPVLAAFALVALLIACIWLSFQIRNLLAWHYFRAVHRHHSFRIPYAPVEFFLVTLE